MNKKVNIATSSIVAFTMLLAMAGVVASGLIQVNGERNTTTTSEQNSTKLVGRFYDAENAPELDTSDKNDSETGFQEPLGVTTASSTQSGAKVFDTVMNIQALMLGVLAIGATFILVLAIFSARTAKSTRK